MSDFDREYRHPELKATFDAGPWQDEPDKAQWKHEGFPCLIVRNHNGALCGYVGVQSDHPWNHIEGEYSYPDAHVHGGVTYGPSPCQPSDDESRHICHVPEPGDPDDVLWVGFDCAHGWDFQPGRKENLARLFLEDFNGGKAYRDIAYVKAETESLARQAAEAAR